jgi:flagellar basal body P-ring protein FlgI
MTRHVFAGPRRRADFRPRWPVAALLLLALAGCTHTNLSRGQAQEETDRDRYEVKTIGDVTAVGNPEPVALGGVGLVTGLEGTGGDTPDDGYRAVLEKDLRKRRVKNIKGLLTSPDNAVVLVEARMPAGAGKDDPLDLEVKLPPGSRATSLRGGYLQHCVLYNYDFSRHLDPHYKGPQGMLWGHPLASAEGAILVGVGTSDGDQASRVKQGRIWAGGRCKVEQPFSLVMAPDQQYARVASLVADRINETFTAGLRGAFDTKVALAKDKFAVALRVPAQYRLNQARYLRVVRMIPLHGGADAPGNPKTDPRSYRQRLAADLLEPARTVTAALRLEALGNRSIPALKDGLESTHPLVRFCSAEALAYLGSPSCGEELARAVAEQPLFRAFGLTAMASLDEAVCHLKLRELLRTATDDETRYGTFRALRTLDPRDPAVRGEQLNDSFWLHRVAADAQPLVHLSGTRRAEVVLFGDQPTLEPPFSFLAGEFAVTATEDDRTRCSVARFPLHGAPARKQCPLTVEGVLRAMADLGAQYPEVIALLQQAHSCGGINCRVRCDALPQAPSVYDLAALGAGKGDASELLAGGQDLGATPTLYEMAGPSRSARAREQEAMLREQQPRGGSDPR